MQDDAPVSHYLLGTEGREIARGSRPIVGFLVI